MNGQGWNSAGSIFPGTRGKKKRDENILSWGQLMGPFKSNHFELLRKIKNNNVCSNIGDAGAKGP